MLIPTRALVCFVEMILSIRTGHEDFLQAWLENDNIFVNLLRKKKVKLHTATTAITDFYSVTLE